MEGHPKQVEAAQLLYNAIADRLIAHFFGKGAEHLVPDDEHAGIIPVQIARVGRVMNAVVAGRIHHRFKPAGEAVHHFGMDPELVDQVDRPAEQDHRRMKADEHQRQAEDKADGDKARPCLPQRR